MYTKMLLTQSQIEACVTRMASEIDTHYRLRQPVHSLVLIGILRGAVHFLSDLSRTMHIPHQLDFISLKSYDGVEAGPLVWRWGLQEDVRGKDVLLVEDIVDTGRTLKAAWQLIADAGAATVRTATLLYRKRAPQQQVLRSPPKFIGCTLEHDSFVIGYGLDYKEQYRGLPYVATLEDVIDTEPTCPKLRL